MSLPRQFYAADHFGQLISAEDDFIPVRELKQSYEAYVSELDPDEECQSWDEAISALTAGIDDFARKLAEYREELLRSTGVTAE